MTSATKLWSEEEFELLAPAMPGYVPSQILECLGYITSYNNDTKCPNWVAWHLTKERTDGPFPRKGVPYYDENGTAIGIGDVPPPKHSAETTFLTLNQKSRVSCLQIGPTTNIA